MGDNTTTTWRWKGQTNGNWEAANWTDAYGVEVSDYPDKAKCARGDTVIFGAGATRACANGPSGDCYEGHTQIVEAGCTFAVGWYMDQPAVHQHCAAQDYNASPDASGEVWMFAGRFVQGTFRRLLVFADAVIAGFNSGVNFLQEIVWQAAGPVFTPTGYFNMGGRTRLYLRAPMRLVDNGFVYGAGTEFSVYPMRPEYTFAKEGSGSCPNPTVYAPWLPQHRKRRYIPRIAVAGAR